MFKIASVLKYEMELNECIQIAIAKVLNEKMQIHSKINKTESNNLNNINVISHRIIVSTMQINNNHVPLHKI